MKVLLVEDSFADAEILSHSISSAMNNNLFYKNTKLDFCVADNLSHATEKLRKEDHDLVFLDLFLENDMSVEECMNNPLKALDTLQDELKDSTPPVIVITGYDDANLCIKAVEKGAQDYLVKGEYQASLLAKTIGHALERHKLQKQLKSRLKEIDHYLAKLEISDKELEELVYLASHDLEEPIRKVITFSYKLKALDENNISSKGLDYVEVICSASQKMQKLLDKLLEYSRISYYELEFKEVDLLECLYKVTLDMEEAFNESFAKVIFCEGFPPGITIPADRNQISKAFQHIISNAIKYRKKRVSPVIKIKYNTGANGEHLISFIDNGIGFEEEFKDKIFQQFQRLNGRSELDAEGMGLASVKKIIEGHHGSINVISEPGVGSEFIIKLPHMQKLPSINSEKLDVISDEYLPE
ncbi:MAG: response regulator [Candidatus Caenarcaniphilales bacterium]|nr:response regulator [Candidatus Caenarcaniphilales bacterium]